MIDTTMYTVSQLFLTPTLVLILLMFVYSFIALGSFIYEGISRRKNIMQLNTNGAYPILRHYNADKQISMEKLELFAFKKTRECS